MPQKKNKNSDRKCFDCSHYFAHPGCIHNQGNGDAPTCPVYEHLSLGLDDDHFDCGKDGK